MSNIQMIIEERAANIEIFMVGRLLITKSNLIVTKLFNIYLLFENRLIS
jgi:hypothetical protein